jgi:hypothetical protein
MPRRIRIAFASDDTLPYQLPDTGEAVAISFTGSNTAMSIKPTDWGNDNWSRSLFDSFGGGTFVPTYSTHGAYVLAGTGGHNHPDHIGAAVFDFTTGLWSRVDVANAGTFNTAGTPYAAADLSGTPHYEINLGQSPGTEVPAPPHPYANLAYYDNGANGSVIYVTRGAVGVEALEATSAHSFDLNTGLWNRETGAGPFSMTEGTVVWDEARNRWWLVPEALHNYDKMNYLDPADMTFKQTASSGDFFSSGTSAGGTVSPRSMLHDTYLIRNAGPTGGLWLYDPDNPTAQDGAGRKGWRSLMVSGTLPDPQIMWARYSNGNWYSYPAQTGDGPSSSIFRIQPPDPPSPGDPSSGTWIVDSVTLGGASLPEPQSYSGTYQCQYYTRFFYVAALGCLAWIPGKTESVYLLKPGS